MEARVTPTRQKRSIVMSVERPLSLSVFVDKKLAMYAMKECGKLVVSVRCAGRIPVVDVNPLWL